jgi:hypothetical protein
MEENKPSSCNGLTYFFWDVMLSSLVHNCQYFGEIICLTATKLYNVTKDSDGVTAMRLTIVQWLYNILIIVKTKDNVFIHNIVLSIGNETVCKISN